MAAIPGLIVLALATGAVIHSSSQFARVSRVVTPGGRATENTGQGSSAARRDCVETYGVTLKTSEYYVPEGSFGAPPRARDAPRELSTVVQGMARNGCGAPLKDVRILIRVRDDEGRRGSSWARVGPLAAGETGPFERAWMGRVTSYDIVEIR